MKSKTHQCKYCGSTMERHDWARHLMTIKLPFGFKLELLRGGRTDLECPNECNIP
jgi:hypothetical protein